jgi:DNA-binding NarL/FixJ family response regulator
MSPVKKFWGASNSEKGSGMHGSKTSGLVDKSPPAVGEGDVTSAPSGAGLRAERPTRRRKKQRALLVFIDPAPLTRQSISGMFAKALPEYEIVVASSCDELLQMPGGPPRSPALVVINIRSVSVMDAWVQSALDFVKLQLGAAPVVLLSDRDDVDDVFNALAHGVRGYVNPWVEPEVVFAALKLVHAGGTFFPAQAIRATTANANSRSDCTRQNLMTALDFTPRELSVVDLLREGKPNKLIAAELQMQESTVKVHVRNIMKKLHVANRTHAASVANRLLAQPASQAGAPPALGGSNGEARLLTAHAEAPGG